MISYVFFLTSRDKTYLLRSIFPAGIGPYQVEKNTKAERNKTQLMWIGPYQVEKVISRNVYLVKDLTGKEYRVHSTRIRYYDGKDFKPNKDIEDLFQLNKKELEVEKFIDLKKKNKILYVLTQWKGFQEEENTYEPVQIMCEDVPELFEQFLDDYSGNYRKQALEQPQRTKGLEINKITISFPTNSRTANLYSRAKGWNMIEDFLLKQAVRKHGLGCWGKIIENNYLADKNLAQFVSRVRALAAKQSLKLFTGVKLCLNKLRKRNIQKFKVKYKINDLRDSSFYKTERQRKLERLFVTWYCSVGVLNSENIEIPSYSRAETLSGARDLYLNLVGGNNVIHNKGNNVIHNKENKENTLSWLKAKIIAHGVRQNEKEQLRPKKEIVLNFRELKTSTMYLGGNWF